MWRYFLLFLFFSNEVLSQDFDPPFIKSFIFTPDTIDVTNSSKTITVRVEALDSTGVKNPGEPVYVQLSSNATATQKTGSLKLVSGTVKNGIWETTITIPKGAQPGSWSVFTNPWSDSLNNSGFFVNTGSTKYLVVQNSNPKDSDPPFIKSFIFTPDTIDVTNSSKTITVRVEALDSTGVKNPGEPVYVQLSSNATATQKTGSLKLVSGTVKNGIWETTITIPKGAQPGSWSVFTNPWSDSLNNSGFFVNTGSTKYLVVNLLQTSGILSQNLVINKVNSPYKLTGDLQIPENLSLTINEGVIFDGSGYSIRTKGNITATGSKGKPIQIKNLTIYGLSGLPTLDFNYCIISNSNLTKPTGNSDNPKQLNLKNSYYNTENKFSGNDATIYIYQFPTLIQNNIFENSPTIVNTFVKSGENVIIKNNNFISWPTNIYYKGLITLNVFDSSKYQINGNCFTDTNKIAATYESSFFSKEFTIKNNFWGTTNVNTIDKMIYDKKDNISFLDLKYSPFLNTCPIETPKFILPRILKKVYEIHLKGKPPENNLLVGVLESANIDSSLFNFFSVKLKNKADSQFVYLNNNNILKFT